MILTNGTRLDTDAYLTISHFLYKEARILDERRYDDWLNLLTPDIEYRMPVRVTQGRADGTGVVDEMAYFEEDMTTLRSRLARLATTSAWSEDPPSRDRHFISNIEAESLPAPDEFVVRSNLLFVRSRGGAPLTDQFSAARTDTLRIVDNRLLLARRIVQVDQSVLGTLNLTTIY